MTTPALVLFPCAGFANRMRVIACARVLAGMAQRDLFVNWYTGSDCRAEWADLFEDPLPDHPLRVAAFEEQSCLYRPEQFPCYYDDLAGAVLNDDRPQIGLLTSVAFRTIAEAEFSGVKSAFYRSLRPVPRVAEKVRRFTAEHDMSRVIGVHIRRSDLTSDKGWNPHAVSPLGDFIAACRRRLEAGLADEVFIATDSASDERALRRVFGPRVVAQPDRILARDTVEGIQDALVDWLLLSQASFVVRSYFSSFSEEACAVHRIDSRVVLRERHKLAVQLSDFCYSPGRKMRAVTSALRRKLRPASQKPLADCPSPPAPQRFK